MKWVQIIDLYHHCKALQIQSPSTNKNGKFPERAKQLEGPWATMAPTGWGDTDSIQLQLKDWAQHTRWICCQMTGVYREIKPSVWAVCTLKLEFRPTIFIADMKQMTFETNWDPSSELFDLLLIYFALFCTSSVLWVREKHEVEIPC